MTQGALAEAAQVSQGTVSDIESGRIASPASGVIENISKATSFPQSYFYRGSLPPMPDGHYRKLKRGKAQVTKQIRAQVRQIVEIVDQADASMRLPRVTIDAVESIESPDDIERIAIETRARLGLDSGGPIPNMTRAVERGGVVVASLAGEMTDHDGFSTWPKARLGGRPIVALSSGAPGDRIRFNVAHELGHLMLHTHRPGTEPKTAEREAHRFAGATLITEDSARAALRPPVTLRVLMNVKASYGISIAALAQRALDLQIIDKDHFVSLRKQLSARRWTKAEPVEVAVESPQLVGKIVEAMSGEGSSIDRASRLGLPVFAYRSLTAA